jgi:hypothetical protein
MTCAELARLMVSLGAHDALNLDGGGSSTAWRADRGVTNIPSDGSQRVVRNHLGIKTYAEGAPRYCVHHGPLPVDGGAVARPLSSEVSGSWGFSLLDLRLWPAEYIAAYPRGTPVEAARLIRADGDSAIYIVDGGFRRHVPNPNALRGFHLHDNPIEVLSPGAVAAFPEGPPLTQYPYIIVGPAPAHEAFLVDHPLPEPPVDTTDGGMPEPDGGVPVPDGSRGDDGSVSPRRDAGETRGDGAALAPGPISGGCHATSTAGSRQTPAAIFGLALVLAFSRRRANPR